MKHFSIAASAAALAVLTLTTPAAADDMVKMTIGQRGNWDTAVPHLGEKAGIFKNTASRWRWSTPAAAARPCSR